MSISELLTMFGAKIISLLPQSPFSGIVASVTSFISPYIGYFNYFVPVGLILDIFFGWLGCVAVFYLYSIILRWVKVIGD